AGRVVALADGPVVEFDGLVIATGAAPRPLPLPCPDGLRVHQLRTLADARGLAAAMVPGRHLVVVGAGFIGLEVASTARQLGLEVTVLEAASAPLNRVFGTAVGGWFRRLHEHHGVTVRCGSPPEAVETSGNGVRVRLRDGSRISADLVLAGVGAGPVTGWLQGSGLDIADGVRCRPDLATGVPGVVAAGDVARWHNRLFGEEMRVEHWTNAVEQGRHAAATLLGAREPYCPVPYFWTDQFDAKVRVVGRVDPGGEVAWEREDDTSLVVVFGREGVVQGAVCVNAPKRLAHYRRAIADRVAWRDLARDLEPVAPSASVDRGDGGWRPRAGAKETGGRRTLHRRPRRNDMTDTASGQDALALIELFPQHEDWSLQTMRLLAQVAVGGADLFECARTAARIGDKTTDGEVWYREWNRTAREVEAAGEA